MCLCELLRHQMGGCGNGKELRVLWERFYRHTRSPPYHCVWSHVSGREKGLSLFILSFSVSLCYILSIDS